MSHSVFTVVAVIKPDRLESLRRVLGDIESDPAANPRLPFGQFGGLHFASLVIFECPDALKDVPRFTDPILVFENNIDGAGGMSRKTYLAQLVASGPGIDDVYEHCVDYPGRGASPESKLGYLLKRVRTPQLYHVGTPYRTVGSIRKDRNRRRRWDRRLEGLMRDWLARQLLTPVAGTSERWVWERLRQRITWAGFGLIAGLLVRGLWRHTVSVSWLYPHSPSLLVFLAFAGSLAFFAMADSRVVDPERLRIPQWMPLTIAAFVLGIAVQALWGGRRPLALLSLLTPIPACLWIAALGDMSYNRHERLEALGAVGDVMGPASVLTGLHRLKRQTIDRLRWFWLLKQRMTYAGVGLATGLIVRLFYPRWPSVLLLLWFGVSVGLLARVDSGEDDNDSLTPAEWMSWAIAALLIGIAPQSIWSAYRWWGLPLLFVAAFLLQSHAISECEPPLWQRLWNWKWGGIAWLGMWVFILLVGQLPVTRLPECVAGLFFLKAWWLSALAGWSPLNPLKPRWHPKVLAFVIAAPIAGFFLTRFLLLFEWLPFWMAPAVLGGLLALWAVPLPSTPEASEPRTAESLAVLRDQEDLQVQNHMAAMVVLRKGLLRPQLLKLFLWTLNWLFFRAVLPDVFRGKLFGLPTVQFCQWVLLDSRRYLFLSNYDHSWSRYLDDFGLQLTTGIQKIWGQGQGNPGTSNLEGFKDFARTTMSPHAVWYSAYPGLSLVQVWNHQQIRRELCQSGNDQSAVVVLRRFAAGPRVQNAFSK